MARDPLAAVKYLDGARGGAGVHLLAEQSVRHRVKEAIDLNMVIDADASEAPFGKFVVLVWQGLHDRSLDCLEQLAAADPQSTHLTAVHSLEGDTNCSVAFGQGER